jgi:hypothetical protein
MAEVEKRRVPFLNHRRKISQIQVEFEGVKAELKAAFKDAKADGFRPVLFDIAASLTDPKSRGDKIGGEVLDRLEVAHHVQHELGAQLSLFVEHAAQAPLPTDPYAEGRQVGLEGGRPIPPDHWGQDDAQQWMAGYHEAMGERVRANIRPMDAPPLTVEEAVGASQELDPARPL